MPSYSPVYSSQFILYTDAAPNQSFEVPTGYTAVVRDITAFATAAATFVQVSIGDAADAPLICFASIELAGLEVAQLWQGRVVVEAGGFIVLTPGGLSDGLQVYVGGYLLRNTLS